MKAWPVLITIGVVAILIGVGFLASALTPSSAEEVSVIPAGANWYLYYDFSVLGSGRLTGSFAETGGGVVQLYVFRESEYLIYEAGGAAQFLYRTEGTSSAFSVDLPESGTYYLVFQHASGYEGAPQSVHVNVTLAGVRPTPLAVGAVATVGAVAVLALGAWSKRRYDRAMAMRPMAPWGVAPGVAMGPPPPYPWPPGVPPTGTPPPGVPVAGPPGPFPAQPARTMVCPACGTAYPGDQRFCVRDGTALREAAGPAPPTGS